MSETDRKTCTRCALTKPTDAFGNDKRQHDGKAKVCKACTNSRAKENRETADRLLAKVRTSANESEPDPSHILSGQLDSPWDDSGDGWN